MKNITKNFILIFLAVSITLHAKETIHDNPYGYDAAYQDKNDLLYLNARYLSVNTGIAYFVTHDPMDANQKSAFDGEYNGFADNPIMNQDPSGFSSLKKVTQDLANLADLDTDITGPITQAAETGARDSELGIAQDITAASNNMNITSANNAISSSSSGSANLPQRQFLATVPQPSRLPLSQTSRTISASGRVRQITTETPAGRIFASAIEQSIITHMDTAFHGLLFATQADVEQELTNQILVCNGALNNALDQEVVSTQYNGHTYLSFYPDAARMGDPGFPDKAFAGEVTRDASGRFSLTNIRLRSSHIPDGID